MHGRRHQVLMSLSDKIGKSTCWRFGATSGQRSGQGSAQNDFDAGKWEGQIEAIEVLSGGDIKLVEVALRQGRGLRCGKTRLRSLFLRCTGV